MTPSPARLAANQSNAQLSTGPTAPEGKERTRLNAFRHGLTGQTVLIEAEEKEIYLNFTRQFFEALKPEGTLERQFAHSASDAQWRINRIKTMEDAMIAKGNNFEDSAKAFATLSLYESRLRRGQEKSLTQLKALQKEREAKHKAAMEDAMMLKQFDEMEGRVYDPQSDGFVFSASALTAELTRRRRSEAALAAKTHGYNLKSFRRDTNKEAFHLSHRPQAAAAITKAA